jgi:hypothetical protein
LLANISDGLSWCDKAFAFSFKDKVLCVTSPGNNLIYGKSGSTLRDAYLHASKVFSDRRQVARHGTIRIAAVQQPGSN